MLIIRESHLAQIRSLGERAYPEECCGVLLGRPEGGVKKVEVLLPARNRRTDSAANRYLIEGEFVRAVEKKLCGSDRQIIGFFHSHPDAPARPSQYDRRHAWPWYSYVIVSVKKGEAVETLSWTLLDDRSGFDLEPLEIDDLAVK